MTRRDLLRPSELVTWDPEREEIVARYVQKLMDILTIDREGRVQTTQHFKLDAYVRILSHSVRIAGVEDAERKRSLVGRAAFRRLKKYRIQSVAAFRRAVAAEARQHLRGVPQKYWILFPLHVSPANMRTFRWFTVLGTRLRVRSWKRVRSDFDLDRFLRDTALPMDGLTISLEADFTPIMAMVEGRNSHEAFREAGRAFDLFRSLLTVAGQFGRMYKRFGYQLKPLGSILPSPVYGVFESGGAYLEYWYSTKTYPMYERSLVQSSQVRVARSLAKRLACAVGGAGTGSLVVEAVEKYGDAMDAREWRHCFLIFWQILELLTLQTNGLNIKQVTNRICALLGQDQLTADLLRVLYDTRNELVHLGRFPAEDEQGLIEINLLKHVVDASLGAMLAQLTRVPDRDTLDKFYRHATLNDTELARLERVVRNVRRDRAKSRNP
jgi:hypothetical protein